MKTILISTLSTILLSTMAVPALSQVSLNSSKTSDIVEITPFALVTGAYQGRFENQGIPSSGIFLNKIRTNKIDAEDLVKGAIAAGRLSENTLNDKSYLNSVESLIDNLDKD